MRHYVSGVVYRRFNKHWKSKNLWNANPPNGETWTWKPVVQTLRVSEYRCQSVSITAENDFVLATSTFSPVSVPSTTRLLLCTTGLRYLGLYFSCITPLTRPRKKVLFCRWLLEQPSSASYISIGVWIEGTKLSRRRRREILGRVGQSLTVSPSVRREACLHCCSQRASRGATAEALLNRSVNYRWGRTWTRL